jgi:trimeric autotransporter adhesin
VSSPNLVVTMTANDMASAAIRNLQGELAKANAQVAAGAKHQQTNAISAEKMGYSWGKVVAGLSAASLGFAAVTTAITDSIQAAAADEKAARSLAQTLANVGEAAAVVGVEDGIERLSRQAAVADDDLRPALQKLLLATGDVEQSQSALSLALDIAAGTGKDLQAVSLALAKGYSGQTTALSRLGVGLDKATLASGDMDAITAALSEKFQGQAQEAADSYAGRLQGISIAADEAKEAVGYALLGAVDDLTEGLGGSQGAASAIYAFGDGLASMISTAGDGVLVLKELAGAAQDLATGGETAGLRTQVWEAAISALGETVKRNLGGPLYMLGEAYDKLGLKAEEHKTYVDRLKIAQQQASAAQRDASAAADELAESEEGVAQSTDVARERVEAFKDALDLLAGGTRSAIDAEATLQEKIDKLSGAVEKGAPAWDRQARAFDLTKESGRKAAGSLNDVASAAEDAATAAANEGDWDKARSLLDTAREALIKQARQWGLTKAEARKYVDTILAIPSQVTTYAKVVYTGGTPTNPAGYKARAVGGIVTGPGTSTSDSVPTMLSNGEYVVRADAVRKVGIPFLEALNTGRVARMAKGGPVTFTNTKPTPAWQVAGTGSAYKPGSYNWITQTTNAPKGGVFTAPAGDDGRAVADAARAAADAAEAAARAAAEAAEAEARRLEEIRRQQQALIAEARRLVEEAGRTRDDFAKTVALQNIGYGSITGFKSVAESSDYAALTLRAPGSLGAGDYGPAQQASGSITGYMQGRLDRVRAFGDAVKKLAGAGLNQSTLREIVNAGPEDGYTLAQALLDAGSITQVNSIQAQLEDASGALGAWSSNVFYGAGVVDAAGNYNRVVGANGGSDDLGSLNVTLELDGDTVVTKLLAIKRARGGVSLGLG